MSTNKPALDEEQAPIRRQTKEDSFTAKIQNNQALQLNRGFMKRPTSGKRLFRKRLRALTNLILSFGLVIVSTETYQKANHEYTVKNSPEGVFG